MNESAPAIPINLSGTVRIIDLDSQEVRYVATEIVGDLEVPTVQVTITHLPETTLRALAQRAGAPLPCSIRFG